MFSFKEISFSAFIYRLYPLFIGFAALSIVTNIFTEEDLSVFIVFHNLKSYFGFFLTFGLAPIITRNISISSNTGWNINKGYKAMLYFFFTITLIFLFLNLDVVYFLSLISGFIFGLYYLIESYYRGKKSLFRAIFFTKILLPSILFTTILSKFIYDLNIESILFVYIFIGFSVFCIFVLRNIKIFKKFPNKDISSSDIQELSTVFFISAIANGFIILPIVALNFLGNQEILNQVGIAIMLSNITLLIFQVGNENFAKDFNVLVSEREIVKVIKKNKKIGQINCILAMFLCFCFYFMETPLSYVFNVESNDYIYMAILISLFYAVSMLLGLSGLILLAMHKSKLLLKNAIVTLLVSASLYLYFLIFNDEYNGYTVSLLIGSTYLFYFFLNFISARIHLEKTILNS